MGSSDHKSSTRRFHKVFSTLKGNSPNSSINMMNREMSDYSNPYYEQSDSPFACSPGDELKILKILAQK